MDATGSQLKHEIVRQCPGRVVRVAEQGACNAHCRLFRAPIELSARTTSPLPSLPHEIALRDGARTGAFGSCRRISQAQARWQRKNHQRNNHDNFSGESVIMAFVGQTARILVRKSGPSPICALLTRFNVGSPFFLLSCLLHERPVIMQGASWEVISSGTFERYR
jgi:hypothetical protein